MAEVDIDGKHGLFLHERLTDLRLHTRTYWKYTDEVSNIACDEDIMENNYIFVLLWNLTSSVVTGYSHNAFFFFYF